MPQQLRNRKPGSKRDKYASHACVECQRRKVKCSGEPFCSNCRTRGAECEYEDVGPRGPRPKKRSLDDFAFGSPEFTSQRGSRKQVESRSTLRAQLAQLQEKVDELMQDRVPNALFSSISPERPRDFSPSAISCKVTTTSPDSGVNVFVCGDHDPCNPTRIFHDSDVFDALTPASNPIGLGSQIEALKKLGCRSSSTKARQLSVHSAASPQLTVRLPPPHTLWALVTVFLAEFGCYFPCLHGDKVRQQLASTLAVAGYDEYRTEMCIGDPECEIIAVLLNMLAYAEALTQSSSAADNLKPHLGAERYYQGVKIMEHFGKVHANDLLTTIYHTTACAYLLEMGMLQMSFQSVNRAFQSALCIGLNDEHRWPVNAEAEDIACRQSLWWTIFFLDKRIAQKIGIAYCVRQAECAVTEYGIDHGKRGSQSHHDFLQSMILFSQLWAQIWDAFYSPRATAADHKQKGDEEYAWEQLKLTDIKIILAYRRIPSRLSWSSQKVGDYVSSGDGEKEIRRRLLVFLRFAFLRLSIRYQPIPHNRPDCERRRSCISICVAVIEAIRAYTALFGYHKPSGHVLTSALVECLYCIVYEQQHQETGPSPLGHGDSEEPVVSRDTLEKAKSSASVLLHRLALTTVGASRACEALGEVLSPPANNFHSESHDYDLSTPALVGSDTAARTAEGDFSLLCDLWQTSPNTAGNATGAEAMACREGLLSEPQRTPPLLGGCSITSEDPFGDSLGCVDWDSILPILPLGDLG